jgi:hypothetical protein
MTWCCELRAAAAGSAEPLQLRRMLISVPSALCRSVSGVQARWGPAGGMAATANGAATVATIHEGLLGLDTSSDGGFVHEAGPVTEMYGAVRYCPVSPMPPGRQVARC